MRMFPGGGAPAALPMPERALEKPALPPPSNVAEVVEEAADHPVASMEHVRQWDWPIQRFGARCYVEEYRFVNLDQVPLHEAYETFVWGVEQISDHLCQLFEPGD